MIIISYYETCETSTCYASLPPYLLTSLPPRLLASLALCLYGAYGVWSLCTYLPTSAYLVLAYRHHIHSYCTVCTVLLRPPAHLLVSTVHLCPLVSPLPDVIISILLDFSPPA